jgi:hypothetical protein
MEEGNAARVADAGIVDAGHPLALTQVKGLAPALLAAVGWRSSEPSRLEAPRQSVTGDA